MLDTARFLVKSQPYCKGTNVESWEITGVHSVEVSLGKADVNVDAVDHKGDDRDLHMK
jgi:hypothetical protein